MVGRHEHAFNEVVEGIINTPDPDVTDEAVANAYLMCIASSLASIADSLEKMSDHMTADPFKKALAEYRKSRREELHV
jgi:hypothetical protein